LGLVEAKQSVGVEVAGVGGAGMVGKEEFQERFGCLEVVGFDGFAGGGQVRCLGGADGVCWDGLLGGKADGKARRE
jgi:hypothetical protein